MKLFGLRSLALIAVAALGLGTLSYSQTGNVTVPTPRVTSIGNTDIMQVVPNAAPSAGNVYASVVQLRAWFFGGNSELTSAPPVLTSCGGGTPSVSGNNYQGTITVGTTATGCVATFATAWAVAPTCVVSSRTAPATTTPAYTVSATALTLTQASGSSNLWDYICMAKQS